MIRLLISGISGFMGRAVRNLAIQNPTFTVVGGVDKMPDHNAECPIFSSFDDVNVDVDVIIDFGAPSLTASLLDFCERTSTRAVICTTGLDENTKVRIHNVSEKMATFYSANMSFGANLMAELCRTAAALLYGEFDIEIVEAHHRRKLDAPSGTALMLADEVRNAIEKAQAKNPNIEDITDISYAYDRSTRREARPTNEIGIHAVRGGGVVGEHEVMFLSDNEVVKISHSAMSREVFASGALRAATFLAGKPAGLYDMKDVIKFSREG